MEERTNKEISSILKLCTIDLAFFPVLTRAAELVINPVEVATQAAGLISEFWIQLDL